MTIYNRKYSELKILEKSTFFRIFACFPLWHKGILTLSKFAAFLGKWKDVGEMRRDIWKMTNGLLLKI